VVSSGPRRPGPATTCRPKASPCTRRTAGSGSTHSLPVHHRGEVLGALSLTKPPGERLTPAEETLQATWRPGPPGPAQRPADRGAPGQAGGAQGVQAAIVAASDAERRRLERNIHDGAQQQLVALAVKIAWPACWQPRTPKGTTSWSRPSRRPPRPWRTPGPGPGDLPSPPPRSGTGCRPHLPGPQVPPPGHGGGRSRLPYDQDTEAAVYFCCWRPCRTWPSTRELARHHPPERRPRLSHLRVTDDVRASTHRHRLRHRPAGHGRPPVSIGGRARSQVRTWAGTTVSGRLPARSLEPVG